MIHYRTNALAYIIIGVMLMILWFAWPPRWGGRPLLILVLALAFLIAGFVVAICRI